MATGKTSSGASTGVVANSLLLTRKVCYITVTYRKKGERNVAICPSQLCTPFVATWMLPECLMANLMSCRFHSREGAPGRLTYRRLNGLYEPVWGKLLSLSELNFDRPARLNCFDSFFSFVQWRNQAKFAINFMCLSEDHQSSDSASLSRIKNIPCKWSIPLSFVFSIG
jgi:hypothetical protein